MELIRRVYMVSVQCFLMAAALVGLMVFLTFLPVHYSATAIQGIPAALPVSNASLTSLESHTNEKSSSWSMDCHETESGPGHLCISDID